MCSLALSDVAPPNGAYDIYDDRTTMTSSPTIALPRHVIHCRCHGDVENYSKTVLPSERGGGKPGTVLDSAAEGAQCHLDSQTAADCRCDCTCEMHNCEVDMRAPLRL